MRHFTSPLFFALLAISAGLLPHAAPAAAAPALPAAAAHAANDTSARIEVRHRRYRSYKDDYYDEGGEVYYPPPEPARIYRVPPLQDRVIEYRRPLPPPPMVVYEPPVYGWAVAPWGTPPRPASCGRYRYWDGEGCADARFDPPYTGPRW